MDKELERLVHKAKRKDPDAFTTLMNAYMQHLYKTARAILMNDEDSADAIQETIITCWEKLGTLKENQYFKTWVTKILINECYSLIRGRKGVIYVDEIPEIPDDREESDLVWKEALAVLSEDYRWFCIMCRAFRRRRSQDFWESQMRQSELGYQGQGSSLESITRRFEQWMEMM